MTENKKLTFFNHFSEQLKSFTGLDLEFSSTTDETDVTFRLKTTGISEQTAETLLDTLIEKINAVLSYYYNRSNQFEVRQFISAVEEIALLIIFYSDSLTVKSYDLMAYSFINLLKEASIETYESAHTSLGFFYFQKPYLNIQQELQQMGLEYIPIRPMNIRAFINDKRSLRLIDNKHLSLVVNHEFLVTGFVRKQSDCDPIRIAIISMYNEVDELKLQYMYYSSLYTYLNEQLAANKIKLSRATYDAFSAYIFSNLDTLKTIRAQKEKKIPPFQFLDIYNRELNWYTNHNFTLRLANGNWKVKHYLALKAILLEKLLPYNCDQTLSYLVRNYSPIQPNVVDITIKRIDRIVSLIKRLSQAGKGSLFIILLDHSCDTDRPQRQPIIHEEARQKIPGDLLLKGSTSLNKFIHVIQKDDFALNILDADFLYSELLASIDGAVILDSSFNFLSFGELLNVSGIGTEALGARTAAAYAGSRFGIAIKVSQDGDVLVLHNYETLIEI
ncbi:hypothetical protein MUG87_01070 [Ectobacillus sp. JY-23]|uniref:hypothetical protein n=1 Tax=Ectobacillus sp. JY-23 TaxID=2933872 RepID=UPI001FF59A64|nr:hypothetical protein [Ectobacillus sp. JY-23]UOY92770.1 hypothetical protein MUG87_01070 [Ectobacillus sp. JY-23]